MQDDDREGKGNGPRGPGRRDAGPQGTEFLDLEISRVLFGEAEGLARESVRDILRGALQERLRARLGNRLEAIAHLAADALADEIEANLGIERIVRSQGERKRDVEERLRIALTREEKAPAPAPPAPRSAPRRTRRS